ncbi:MAG: helix-turn-helix transcriptional regulator [Lachnospiraceae bacterium]|nr:helix-turn-helix transcriptional regulator [Lachnospiraceae bacterium]
MDKKGSFSCPVEATISLIGGKYKAIILWHLLHGTMRYSELHRKMPHATDKMLAQQLRELEKDGLIARTVYPVVPPKTEYNLTEFGQSLAPILDAMCNWGNEYLQSSSCSNTNSSF